MDLQCCPKTLQINGLPISHGDHHMGISHACGAHDKDLPVRHQFPLGDP